MASQHLVNFINLNKSKINLSIKTKTKRIENKTVLASVVGNFPFAVKPTATGIVSVSLHNLIIWSMEEAVRILLDYLIKLCVHGLVFCFSRDTCLVNFN